MTNIVYTGDRIKAMVEETRLNADPQSNHGLYTLMHNARKVLRHSHPENISPDIIARIEEGLAYHSRSYAARQCREELLEYEAGRIIRAQDVFELDRVARLVRDLGEYKTVKATESRKELDELWQIVQDAQYCASGIRNYNDGQVKWLLEVLKPYQNSEMISDVHRRLKKEQQLSA